MRVDVPRLERFYGIVSKLLEKQEQQLFKTYGINGEILRSNKQLTKAMSALGITSPNKTATGQPCWDHYTLPLIDHPVVQGILNYKNLEYVTGNRGIGKLRECLVGDRIYTTFYPCKREDGGAYTGRLGSRAPNLQNIASREDSYGEKAWGPEMRSLFLPDEGYNMIGAVDYGQIETRMMAHYGVGKHARWFREQCKNPNVDMHQLAMDATGITSRYIIKRINFGIPYGMGIRHMVQLDYPMFREAAHEHGVTDVFAYGDTLMRQFRNGFPVLFDMMADIQDKVRKDGYRKSLGGRIRHRPPAAFDPRKGTYNVPYYKMVAIFIQGSAAEVLKKGIADSMDAGVFSELTMHLTVHDENVCTIPFNKIGTEAVLELERCMRNAYVDRLTVPLTVATEIGPNWGYWKKDIWEAMKAGDYSRQHFDKVYAPVVRKNWWSIQNGYKGIDNVLTFKEDK